MQQLALIADIHGNMEALRTVAHDIKQRGITQIYCMGDMVGKGPQPGEVIDWCRQNCAVVLLGNHEDYMLQGTYFYPHVLEEIGKERLDWLATLPLIHKMWISGRRVCLLHGRPVAPLTGPFLTEQAIETMFKAVEEKDDLLDWVGYADIHRQIKCDFSAGSGKTLFNIGSVGSNYSEPLCSYTILKGELHSKEKSAFSFEYITLPYDNVATAKLAQKSTWLPNKDDYLYEVLTGKYFLNRPHEKTAYWLKLLEEKEK
ncbi:MAG: metallophosphoesterase family protein [Oscillospiraceae bacterium]|nr:metallophosphoesterase family protein [Oscillospiraceae bacterium]